jgi:hypothetical protein
MSRLMITSEFQMNGTTVLISGAALYEGEQRPDPAALRRRGQRRATHGLVVLEQAPSRAEALLRGAIEDMVDAFLLDRVQNADLFARAHQIGALIEQTFSCACVIDRDHGTLVNDCGILALHSRLGLSPGGTTWGHCSLCGAKDFMCDHIPGSVYEGEKCVRNIDRWDAEEVSMTQRPREPRCFRTWAHTKDSYARRVGGNTPGRCWHCRMCRGRGGPTTDDLDPAQWSDDGWSMLEAAIAVAQHAVTRPSIIND